MKICYFINGIIATILIKSREVCQHMVVLFTSPFPTPGTMLMLIHVKYTGPLFQHCFGGGGRGARKLNVFPL